MSLKYFVLSAVIITSLHAQSIAQEYFKLNTSTSTLVITGTSSIHDWEMNAEEFKCDAIISVNENTIEGIANVDFVCQVEMIKSHNKIMDNKTYKALNSKEYPEIKFQISENEKVNISNELSSMNGILSLAGSKKDIDVKFKLKEMNDKEIVFSGELPLKMSDFNIKPPTAMMGTLKTGDEVLIKYEFVFAKSNEQTVDNQ